MKPLSLKLFAVLLASALLIQCKPKPIAADGRSAGGSAFGNRNIDFSQYDFLANFKGLEKVNPEALKSNDLRLSSTQLGENTYPQVVADGVNTDFVKAKVCPIDDLTQCAESEHYLVESVVPVETGEYMVRVKPCVRADRSTTGEEGCADKWSDPVTIKAVVNDEEAHVSALEVNKHLQAFSALGKELHQSLEVLENQAKSCGWSNPKLKAVLAVKPYGSDYIADSFRLVEDSSVGLTGFNLSGGSGTSSRSGSTSGSSSSSSGSISSSSGSGSSSGSSSSSSSSGSSSSSSGSASSSGSLSGSDSGSDSESSRSTSGSASDSAPRSSTPASSSSSSGSIDSGSESRSYTPSESGPRSQTPSASGSSSSARAAPPPIPPRPQRTLPPAGKGFHADRFEWDSKSGLWKVDLGGDSFRVFPGDGVGQNLKKWDGVLVTKAELDQGINIRSSPPDQTRITEAGKALKSRTSAGNPLLQQIQQIKSGRSASVSVAQAGGLEKAPPIPDSNPGRFTVELDSGSIKTVKLQVPPWELSSSEVRALLGVQELKSKNGFSTGYTRRPAFDWGGMRYEPRVINNMRLRPIPQGVEKAASWRSSILSANFISSVFDSSGVVKQTFDPTNKAQLAELNTRYQALRAQAIDADIETRRAQFLADFDAKYANVPVDDRPPRQVTQAQLETWRSNAVNDVSARNLITLPSGNRVTNDYIRTKAADIGLALDTENSRKLSPVVDFTSSRSSSVDVPGRTASVASAVDSPNRGTAQAAQSATDSKISSRTIGGIFAVIAAVGVAGYFWSESSKDDDSHNDRSTRTKKGTTASTLDSESFSLSGCDQASMTKGFNAIQHINSKARRLRTQHSNLLGGFGP